MYSDVVREPYRADENRRLILRGRRRFFVFWRIAPMADRVLLASASPRRRELLKSMGIGFEVLSADVDESLRDVLPARERVVVLAQDKAEAAGRQRGALSFRWILAADTLVWLPAEGDDTSSSAVRASGGRPEEVFGKPRDKDDARRMLSRLSGRAHRVSTGLCLLDRWEGSAVTARSDSSVWFEDMNEKQLEAALEAGDWEGVAGAYRIQGYAARHIERIEGSWSGIVGLPIHELYGILVKSGFVFQSSFQVIESET
jgi:septum formation protein